MSCRFLSVVFLLWPAIALPEAQSLFRSDTFARPGSALIPVAAPDDATSQSASLFIGIDGTSFFRPYPVRRRPEDGSVVLHSTGSAVAQLRSLISYAESRRDGYDAVNYGARVRPPKRPTQMTLEEIYTWIEATPGQPHAIGRYQFIPATLDRVVRQLGVPRQALFSPQMQDRLSDVLLAEAGFNAFRDGDLGRQAFMNNLAKIWAGLPNSSGRSHYHGYAGNKASMTWDRFESEMKRIFPN